MCNNCYRTHGPDQIITGCCLVQSGYYCIWELDHMALVCEEWAELCDLRDVLRQISCISFSVVSDRQRARTAINNIKRNAPFGECKRFPFRKTFVNISCSVYGTLFQNILGALDFKNRETEKEMKYGKTRVQDDPDQTARNEYTQDDAATQFRNNIKLVLNELCKNNEVYNRIKFENKYGLTWCLGDCPTEPPYKPPSDEPTPPDNPRRYGALLDKLKAKNLDPRDYSIFTGADLLAGDFKCDRELQTLGEGMRNTRIPDGVTSIYVFTSGEYANCGDSENPTKGFNYRVASNQLIGQITLRPLEVHDEDEDYKNFLESVDHDSIMRKAFERRHMYSHSRLPSRIQSPLGSDYAEASHEA